MTEVGTTETTSPEGAGALFCASGSPAAQFSSGKCIRGQTGCPENAHPHMAISRVSCHVYILKYACCNVFNVLKILLQFLSCR